MKENWIISDICVDIDSDEELPEIELPITVYCKEEDIDDEVSNAIGYAIHWCTYEMEEDDLARIEIPEWAICYLVNGGLDNLTDEELAWCRDFEKEYHVVDWEEESHFTWKPIFGLACNVYTCKCEVL